jgi:cell division transport system ATP-binding protein
MEIMSQVGIDLHKDKFPVQLSGGELQRVAIARAIVFAPQIIIADEPTGNLDSDTSWGIVKLLQEINETGTTVLMATHNIDIVKTLGRRIIVLDKGVVVKDEASTHKPKEPKLDEELVSKTEHTTQKKHKKEL